MVQTTAQVSERSLDGRVRALGSPCRAQVDIGYEFAFASGQWDEDDVGVGRGAGDGSQGEMAADLGSDQGQTGGGVGGELDVVDAMRRRVRSRGATAGRW